MSSKQKVVAFLSVLAVVALWSTTGFAQAAQGAAASGGSIFSMWGWLGLAAGLGIGLAAFGGAIGQGRAVGSAMEGLARNPGSYDEVFTPFIVGIALVESLVIYALIVSILLITLKIPGTKEMIQLAGG